VECDVSSRRFGISLKGARLKETLPLEEVVKTVRPHADGNTKYPFQAFALCLVAYSFSQMDLALFVYATPAIRRDFGLSLQQMSAAISVAFALGGVLIVWLGVLTDRIGRKRMFQFSLGVSALLIAVHYFAPNIATLTVLRGLSIAVGGLSYVVTGAIIAEEAPARYRGLFAGFLQTGYPIGWAVAAGLAKPLLERAGWRPVFLIALVSLPYVLVIRFFLREPARFAAAARQKAPLAELFKPDMIRRTVTLFFGQFLFVIAYGGSAFLLTTYLVEARGYSIGQATAVTGKANAIGVIGYILSAIVGEFVITRRNAIILWAWLGTLCFLAMVWWAGTPDQILLAFAAMTIFFYGTAAVKFTFVGEHFPTRLRATGLAFCGSFAVTMGTSLGPLLVSYGVKQAGWNWAFSTVVAIPLFLSGLVFLLLKPIPSGLEVEAIAK
jgi:MFS family permease